MKPRHLWKSTDQHANFRKETCRNTTHLSVKSTVIHSLPYIQTNNPPELPVTNFIQQSKLWLGDCQRGGGVDGGLFPSTPEGNQYLHIPKRQTFLPSVYCLDNLASNNFYLHFWHLMGSDITVTVTNAFLLHSPYIPLIMTRNQCNTKPHFSPFCLKVNMAWD